MFNKQSDKFIHSSRRCVLVLAFAGLGLLVSDIQAAEITRPNIVLIIADNQSAKLIGAYGNKHIMTPNIDKLAAEGILFEHAYSVSGTCSPTRATMLTGLLPSQTGVHMAQHVPVDVANWSAIEEFRNLPQTLHDAGYRTGQVLPIRGHRRHPRMAFLSGRRAGGGRRHHLCRP